MELSLEELGLFQSACEEYAEILRKRLRENKKYIHPAVGYEDLQKKINEFIEVSSADCFTLSAVEI